MPIAQLNTADSSSEFTLVICNRACFCTCCFCSLHSVSYENTVFFFNVKVLVCVISGFRREVDENCALVGCYAASSGTFLPTFRDCQGSNFC